MDNYYIGIFSAVRSRAYSMGYASFRKSGEHTRSRVVVSGIRPNDRYIIFYILQNHRKQHSIAEVGQVSVNRQGKILFNREFDNRIQNGHCCESKDVVGVVLAERHDCALAVPMSGCIEKGIEWKPLVKNYLLGLSCNHSIICRDYCNNSDYDAAIESLPPCAGFEVRDKIENAAEIRDLRMLGLDGHISGINDFKKALLIRMRTGDFVLYLLGLPGTYSDGGRPDYASNNLRTFLSSRAGETLNDAASGWWCKYI